MTKAQALALKAGDNVTYAAPPPTPATVVAPLVPGNPQVLIRYTQPNGVPVTNFVQYSNLT